jgi:homopolymeric O-antigen transport system ATP-binding protein
MPSAIVVEHVSKRYQLGHSNGTTMLRETLVNLVRRPFRRSKRTGDVVWALKDASFSIEPGEVLGVIGRNGSGKSTMLKILAKITRPTSGRIVVNGRVASLLEVGTGFHEELTGRENIHLSGSLLGMRRKQIDAKLGAIIDFAGVDRFLDTPVKHYSSGMTMRLGFSVAAHLESDILLVDEVLAVGDGEFQKKCLQTMDDLRTVGRTVLFVSHNLAAVENLCSRAIWLDAGSVRRDGRPKEVIQAYIDSFSDMRNDDLDLRMITARRGSGDARFTRLQLLSSDRTPVKAIASGDTVVVRLHYAAKVKVEWPVFGLEIYSHLGTLVSQIHTYNSGVEVGSIGPGEGYIDVEIQDLNLMPGRYYLSLALVNRGPVNHDILDHCAVVDIEPSSRYGLNRGLRGGPIIGLSCRWIAPASGG